MSNNGGTRVPSELSADALDDEAPPEIPDITSEPEPQTKLSPKEPIGVEPDMLADGGIASSLRRLSPPPKPRRRARSITAPQTPTSRSFPPALSEESVSLALKPPLMPSLATSPSAPAPSDLPVDLTRTEPSFAPLSPRAASDDIPLDVPIDVALESDSSPQATAPEPEPSADVSQAEPAASRNELLPASSDAEAKRVPQPDRERNGAERRPLEELAQGPAPSSTDANASPLLAMRIITVGDSSAAVAPQSPPPAERSSAAEGEPSLEKAPSSEQDASELMLEAESVPILPATVSAEAREGRSPLPQSSVDAAEELADDDVAPDSEDKVRALDTPAAREAASEPASPAKPHAPPPPPPRRQMPSTPALADHSIPPLKAREEAPSREEAPAPAKAREEAPPSSAARSDETARVKVQRRAWWEDLFNEDFVRAMSRLSEQQVRREVDFIEESLGVASGGVVLDLGCGAGYHAVELASRNYGVVGYDLSLYQLALAADVAQERGQRINFLQGDMREMAFEEMFDGIFCWNTTFGYFDEEKNAAVAQRVFRALRPGGMFLLDVANRDFVAAHQPSQVWYEGDSCVCMDDMSLDFITSRLKVKRSIILDDGRTRESTYSVRLYALHELGKILHDVGFRVTEASGHPSTPGVFFGQCSPRIIILAQRP